MPSGAAFFVGFPWTYYSFHYIDPRRQRKQADLWHGGMVSKPIVYAG